LATRPRLRDAFGSALAASLLVVTCLLFWPSAFAFILVVGGAFAVLLYHRRRPEAHLTAGGAARVGATTGLLCALLFVLKFLTEFLSDGGAAMKQSMIERIRAMSSSNPEAAQRLLTDINQPDYFAAVVVVGIIIVAVLFIASSALGGVVAGRLLRREPR
jgi:hypothetical protein